MIAKTESTLLEQLSTRLSIDADTLDAGFIQTLPIQPHDMTSNPRFLHEQLAAPANEGMVKELISANPGAPWEEIYAKAVGKLAAKVYPFISGKVLAQVLPSQSYDTDAMIKQAKLYRDGFVAAGIDKNRYCIKIPLTGPGIMAAVALKKEGIPTLGTCLFSVPQAVAASQAGMYAVSMYYNEPLAGADASIWPDLEEPLFKHPMSVRHLRMRQAYDRLEAETGEAQPQIKTASFISPREVAAMVRLGADHVTLTKPTLEDLVAGKGYPVYRKGMWKKPVVEQMSLPNFAWEEWKGSLSPENEKRLEEMSLTDPLTVGDNGDWYKKVTSINFVVSPQILDDLNRQDEITNRRLEIALKRFGVFEEQSKEYIKNLC